MIEHRRRSSFSTSPLRASRRRTPSTSSRSSARSRRTRSASSASTSRARGSSTCSTRRSCSTAAASMAFFGTPAEMIEYFRRGGGRGDARRRPRRRCPTTPPGREPAAGLHLRRARDAAARSQRRHHLRGGQPRALLVPARRFSPDYWRDRYQAHRLLEEVACTKLEAGYFRRETIARSRRPPPARASRSTWFTSAPRSSARSSANCATARNLITTLLEAPALAILVASVLRFSEEAAYTFASAFHIPTYIFLSLVIALFLGLTNSADEIIRDRTLLARERGHGIKVWHYVARQSGRPRRSSPSSSASSTS